jgi:hypothetical protein
MDIDQEVELIESIIANIESAISEVKHCEYFEEKASCWEDDLKELNERLEELQAKQSEVWEQEMEWQNREYLRSVI